MKHHKYPLKVDPTFRIFQFKSIGPRGEIVKEVEFSQTNFSGYYNLGFGDKNKNTGEVSDTSNSDNGDLRIIISTVVSAVHVFTNEFTEARIYFKGSDKIRTRLYRMAIANNFTELEKDFILFGLRGTEWTHLPKVLIMKHF